MRRGISILFMLFFVLAGCGQEGQVGFQNDQGEFGNLSATLIWPETYNAKTTLPGGEVLRATLPPTVITVTMTVSGGGFIKFQDFEASDGQGTISGVKVGVKTITFDGKDAAGVTLFRGSAANVEVKSDETSIVVVEMESTG